MSTRLPETRTIVTKEAVILALWEAWVQLFSTVPRKESILVLVAQAIFETGWFKSCKNYNLGNVKSRDGDGYDYCYFACPEVLSKDLAERYASQSPDTAKIKKYREDGKAVIWLYPDHPGCRFRAFSSLLEGAIDHLSLVKNKYPKAWPMVLTGDPVEFCNQLKAQGYFTGDLATYRDSVSSIFRDLLRVPLDWDSLKKTPVTEGEISEEEKQKILNLVVLTLREEQYD